MYSLGLKVTDSITGIKGILLSMVKTLGGSEKYLLKQYGLNSETNRPHTGIWIESGRIEDGVSMPEEEFHYLYLLGKTVTDTISGFNGVATDIITTLDGGTLVGIQPTAILIKTGTTASIEHFYAATVILGAH